ncbi:COMM domain-containing protein 5 [Tachysurus vachellii]|nr:COMM domain-containing protein 5 [Tachysurus vachellii]
MMAEHNVKLWGGRIPREVVNMAKHLKDLDKQLFRRILKAVVNALDGKACSGCMADIIEDNLLSEDKLSDIVSGMYELLREALRVSPSSVKIESFEDDLHDLRIFEEFIADISGIVFGHGRPSLDASGAKHGSTLPKLEKVRWRVDVAISTSSLSRALQPTVILQLTLSDGILHQFEVPVSKFQELRYNVAHILKEMNDLEKRSVLKIKDYHSNYITIK